MEDGNRRRVATDGASLERPTPQRTGGPNGASEIPRSSPGLPGDFSADAVRRPGGERPRPAPVAVVPARRAEKKRPMTYVERLKWLKKCANAKKSKFAKPGDQAAFRSALERRRAVQSLKSSRGALANGDRPTAAGESPEAGREPSPPRGAPFPEGPSVTYKCRKCCRTSFGSLEALKEHQLRCSSQAPLNDGSDAARVASSDATGPRAPRQVVLCSACGTYFESWELFLHMREVHGRHACLFCLGLFSQSEKLASHLATKHGVRERNFRSREELADGYAETFYLMCCRCEVVFDRRDDFATHECNRVVRYCSTCECKDGHRADCPKASKRRPAAPNPSESDGGRFGRNFDSRAYGAASEFRPPRSSVLDGSVLSGGPVSGFEFGHDGGMSDLNSTDVGGVDDFSDALAYVPEPRQDKISPDRLALLIEEVKNCVSVVPAVSTNTNIDRNDSEKRPILGEGADRGTSPSPEGRSSGKSDRSRSSPASEGGESQSVGAMAPFADRAGRGSESSDVARRTPSFPSKTALERQLRRSDDSPGGDEETLNRVPKLTVKVPKAASDRESSDCSSGSEDSDKLTVDLGAGIETARFSSAEIDPNGEAMGLSNPEVGKIDAVSENDVAPAGDDVPIIELTLDQPLDRYPLNELLRVLLRAAVYSCIYCNHARKIAVNGKQLGLHFIAQHKFTATVNSITAEELLPETIISKIKTCLPDVQNDYINLGDNRQKADPKAYHQSYECFQCYYDTSMHKDLYFHNRKMHQKTILLCIMCKSSFYTYSELLCHLCPGMYGAEGEITFRCCLCTCDVIPSAFRLMVHLRKRHLACDVCLETCHNQSKLSSHVWKHKLHHLCYRCGMSYRNKPDITNHLFWKHGTESVLCKKCLQKKWPHVYHFCIPPNSFTCEECNLNFSKAVYLKVHKRLHIGEYPYECKEPGCCEKFISKKLLSKHVTKHSAAAAYVDAEKTQTLSLVGPDEAIACGNEVKDENGIRKEEADASAGALKSKKSKKNKSKDNKDNLLMDVNFPELNLSESGSSDDSELETPDIKIEGPSKMPDLQDAPVKVETADEPKPEPVIGIWDNFKLYQEALETEKKMQKPKHVCESDHDYCLIPTTETPDVEIISETKPKTETPARGSPKKKKASKKNSKSETVSSSSDSSSDSDTTCSGGANCTCSSTSSSSSDSSSSALRRSRSDVRKYSDASHASAVDIMATEESPSQLISKSAELSFAESDLDTEESATDEEFYDKHPQKIANKILMEKRNQLMQSATSPINNGAYAGSSRPPSPEENDKTVRKKMKVKKRKKEKKNDITAESPPKANMESDEIPTAEQTVAPNKITISLQSHKVQTGEGGLNSGDFYKNSSGAMSDADSKRASKRRRVPNKFYGYSSDEEYMLKPQLPPKLEWRKEDLPSPGGTQSEAPAEPPPPPPEPPSQRSEPTAPPKTTPKESTSDDSDSGKEGALHIKDSYSPSDPEAETANKTGESAHPAAATGAAPFPRPAGAREAREGESVYCYCRCPYDEVSEMIACDADGCTIEWFHFECVGIMVPPKGKWYCPDCRLRLDSVHK